MKNLHEIYIESQQKEKKNKTILIVLIGVLSFLLLTSLFIDPWDIAYNKEEKRIKERQEEFTKVYKEYLDDSKYEEAFYIEYNLNLYDISPDLYSLLSDYERIIEYIANDQEGNKENNYYDLDYLVDNFYDEYAYQKKYKAPSNYLEDIKDEVEEYLTVYNYFSLEELNSHKEANSYD